MDSVVRKKNVWYVVNDLQEIQLYYVITVDLAVSANSAVYAMDGLLIIRQWFVMNIRGNVPNVDVMFR